jgi:hypothetical protein
METDLTGPDVIRWKDRRAWARENSKAFPAAADVLTAFVANALVMAMLYRQGKAAQVGDILVPFVVTTVVAFTVTPLALYVANLLKAPRALLAQRVISEERLRRTAERERNMLAAEKNARPLPAPAVWFSQDGERCKLNVRNTGATAVFHANSIVLRANTGPTAGVGHAQRLRWDKAGGVESKIVTGGEDSCCVATIEIDPQPIAVVRLKAICDAGAGAHWPFLAFWSADWFPEAVGIVPSEPRALCQVTITAEPEMPEGPISRRFQLGPGAFHEQGTEGFHFDEFGLLPGDP